MPPAALASTGCERISGGALGGSQVHGVHMKETGKPHNDQGLSTPFLDCHYVLHSRNSKASTPAHPYSVLVACMVPHLPYAGHINKSLTTLGRVIQQLVSEPRTRQCLTSATLAMPARICLWVTLCLKSHLTRVVLKHAREAQVRHFYPLPSLPLS